MNPQTAWYISIWSADIWNAAATVVAGLALTLAVWASAAPREIGETYTRRKCPR